MKQVQRLEGKLIISKPSKGHVRTGKEYIIGREITTVISMAVNHATCDYLTKVLDTLKDNFF